MKVGDAVLLRQMGRVGRFEVTQVDAKGSVFFSRTDGRETPSNPEGFVDILLSADNVREGMIRGDIRLV